jgi:hypothetical protein
VEIIRSSVPTGVKGKKEEDLNLSFHGVVYVDMQPLLYPGATQIKGAYKINSFVDADFANKTKRKNGILDESLKVISSLHDRNFAALPGARKEQKVADKKDNKKARESIVEGYELSQSVQQSLESKSFIVIDIKFEHPLIPRKPFDYLTKRVSDLIPPRPKYPLRANSAQKAVGDYHSQIKNILDSVLDDYRTLFSEENEVLTGANEEEAAAMALDYDSR